MSDAVAADPATAFIAAACVPRDGDHDSCTLEEANAILAAHPEVAGASIHTAAILADDVALRGFLAADPASATARGGPFGWDALTHLCFSRYLRLDPARSEAFVRAAAALLDAGASAGTGWLRESHQPWPEWESALYGAAGVAHHPELTRLLLQRGANANDKEVPYHAPEGHDNAALEVLVESGRLTRDSLATMLLRKSDWHDLAGIQLLLEHGADPNQGTWWGRNALHQALLRDNALEIVEAMLDHGADPALLARNIDQPSAPVPPVSAVQLAAWRGRGDVLEAFARRGIRILLQGADRLIAACARGDGVATRELVAREPGLVRELLAEGGTLLANFAGVGNVPGLRLLLDLGLPVTAPFERGDAYFAVATDSTALHVAAWRGRPAVVALLIERGAPVGTTDGAGHTPLQLAVRACVDSWWIDRRSPESVEALLRAGASVAGVPYPCGYAEVDELLQQHGAG
jgi:ankyrin repeat protein